MRLLVVAALVTACGHPATPTPQPHRDPPIAGPAMLASLPRPAAVDTERFTSVIVCDRCHTPGETQMRGPKGEDVSPVGEIRSGMMFLATRDPYYLAAVRRELLANPGAKPQIESTCLRCHAPVAFAESGGKLTLDDVLAGTGDVPDLSRDGIGCLGCHGLDPAKLGDESTHTGNHTLRSDRVAYGLIAQPEGEAMVQMSKTTPKPSEHMAKSELCASCHTVLVKALDQAGNPTGQEIPEQTTFLEWRNSAFGQRNTGSDTCQGCHMPTSAERETFGGTALITAISTRPVDAPKRGNYHRHTLRGGNSYLLRQLAANTEWLNAKLEPEQLLAAAAGTDELLKSAARLEFGVFNPYRKGPPAIPIKVINQTGHKLPTGYPTRRMWLHVTIRSASGEVVLESGAHKAGAIVDREGNRLDGAGVIIPHTGRIASSSEVMIWEAVPVDAQGKRTHLLLGTSKVVKDNRILPEGYNYTPSPDFKRTQPIGVDADPGFQAGTVAVDLVIPKGAKTIDVELLYQPIPPETIDSYKPTDSKEAARFLSIVAAPPLPVVLATAHHTL